MFLKINNNEENGSVTLIVLLIIMLLVIVGLVYMLFGSRTQKLTPSTGGIDSPNQTLYEEGGKKTNGVFNDGLIKPDFSEKYSLNEFGEGIASKEIFDIDINNDGYKDRITKTKIENGTAHFHYEYKIEINKNGSFFDITPEDFITSEGAECALQKLKFIFKPEFRVIKISRDWKESWITPTQAEKTTFAFSGNEIKPIRTQKMQPVCDVSELF